MPSRFFGQYLMEKGLITREMFLAAMHHQPAIGLPLLALAVSKGYLTEDQLARLDERSRRTGAAPIELAAREGMLSFGQLEELEQGPTQRCLYLGETLVQKGFLSLPQFGRAFALYRQDCPEQTAVTSALPAGVAIPHREIVDSLLDSFIDIFVHYTKQVVRVVGVSTSRPVEYGTPWVFSQQIVGDVCVRLLLAVEEPLVLAIASEMFQQEVTSVDGGALDAVAEFENVVGGTACTRLGEMGLTVKAEPPEVMDAGAVRAPASRDVVALDLETAKASLHFVVLFLERR